MPNTTQADVATDPVLAGHQARIGAAQAEVTERQALLDAETATETQMTNAIQGHHTRKAALTKDLETQMDAQIAATEAVTGSPSHDISEVQIQLAAVDAAIANFPAKWEKQRQQVGFKANALAHAKGKLIEAQYDLTIYQYRAAMTSSGMFDVADNVRQYAAAHFGNLDLTGLPDSHHHKFGRLPAN